ncbi:MAG: hypothetical protein AAF928_05495 [Myxococcota bacterium]
MAAPRTRLGRTGWGILGVSLAGLVAFVVSTQLGRDGAIETPSPTSMLELIPADPLVVVEVDVVAMKATPVGAQLLGEGREVAGIGEVVDICGDDPLAGVERIALAIPEVARVGFGLFAVGAIDDAALLACATDIVRRRGGTPRERAQGAFRVLSDATQDEAGARLAVRAGGPLVLTEPAYLAESVAVRPETSAARSPHAELRAMVPSGLIVATAVLSDTQRATLLDELRVQGATASPLGALRDGAVSIRTDVPAAPAGKRATRGDDERTEVQLAAVLRCDTAPAADTLAVDLEARRAEAARRLDVRLLGLGALLDAIRIRRDGARVHVDLVVPAAQVAALFRRLAALGRGSPSPVSPPPASTESAAPAATAP